MKKRIRKLLKGSLAKCGYDLVRSTTIERYEVNMAFAEEFQFLLKYPPEVASQYLYFKQFSTSQIRQDLFVLCELKFKNSGYFVEFGATDGLSLSNTYILESKFGWKGILAEPGRCWQADLTINRTSHIERMCVWTETGKELNFFEAEKASLSGVGENTTDVAGQNYKVSTISLLDLLVKYDAPETIDYLSIDTEGCEYDILKNFNFGKYNFRVITVEHNYAPSRGMIFKLLTNKGYRRVHQEHSLFDDWYVYNT